MMRTGRLSKKNALSRKEERKNQYKFLFLSSSSLRAKHLHGLLVLAPDFSAYSGTQVAGLHRASPSTSLDKSDILILL